MNLNNLITITPVLKVENLKLRDNWKICLALYVLLTSVC